MLVLNWNLSPDPGEAMGHSLGFCAGAEVSLCSHQQFWGAHRTLAWLSQNTWTSALQRLLSLVTEVPIRQSGNSFLCKRSPNSGLSWRSVCLLKVLSRHGFFDYCSVWCPQVSGQCSTKVFPLSLPSSWQLGGGHSKSWWQRALLVMQNRETSRVSPPRSQEPLCLSHLKGSWITGNIL